MNIRDLSAADRHAALAGFVGRPVRVTYRGTRRAYDVEGLALAVATTLHTDRPTPPHLVLAHRRAPAGRVYTVSAAAITNIVDLGPGHDVLHLVAAEAEVHTLAARYIGGADGMPPFIDATDRVWAATAGNGDQEFRDALVGLAANCLARIVDADQTTGAVRAPSTRTEP